MDRFVALRVFRQVVELGSFAEASRRLNLSPAAVSKNIGELETHLGTRLLNRSTRQLSQTEAGSRYYEYVVRILDQMEEADASLGPISGQPSGVLRVTAPMTLTLIKLSAALPRFLEAYPDLSVDLQMDSRRANIIEEGFDLAIRMSDSMSDSSLIAKKLATMQQVVCGSPEYFSKHGVPQTPEELGDHNCVKFSLSGHVDEWEFRKGAQLVSVAVKGRYKVTSSLAVRDALLSGFGLSLLPEPYIREQLDSGALQTVLDDWQSITSSVYAVYPSKRHLSAKVTAFLDFVADELD